MNSCQRFQSLYNRSTTPAHYCLNNDVSSEYMCPRISMGPAKLPEMPLNPWFAQQSKCNQNMVVPSSDMLGKHILCSGKSLIQRGGYNNPIQGGYIKQPGQGSTSLVGLGPHNVLSETPNEIMLQYINNANTTSSYYNNGFLDLSRRYSIVKGRNSENDIPEVITNNQNNLLNRDFGCRQPTWTPRCV